MKCVSVIAGSAALSLPFFIFQVDCDSLGLNCVFQTCTDWICHPVWCSVSATPGLRLSVPRTEKWLLIQQVYSVCGKPALSACFCSFSIFFYVFEVILHFMFFLCVRMGHLHILIVYFCVQSFVFVLVCSCLLSASLFLYCWSASLTSVMSL